MAIRFGDAVKSFQEGSNFRAKQRQDQLDQLKTIAALNEAGYNIGQTEGKAGLFGTRLFGQAPQMTLTRDPNSMGTKALERQKLELENQKLARENQRESSSVGFTPPAGSKVKYDKFGQPSSYEAPSELDIIKLNQEKQKQADEQQAQLDKEESLRTSAQEMVDAAEEAKKGAKYFGFMGNVPSVAAPSTILSGGKDYGPRRNWEANVGKLKAKQIIDLMSEMKRQSKTGATGFGTLSGPELKVLQNASTQLEKDLAPEDAVKYINQIEGLYQKVLSKKPVGNNEEVDDPLGVLK